MDMERLAFPARLAFAVIILGLCLVPFRDYWLYQIVVGSAIVVAMLYVLVFIVVFVLVAGREFTRQVRRK
jgi:hypothetical protein